MVKRIVAAAVICVATAGCQNIRNVAEAPSAAAVAAPVTRVQSISAELARGHFAAGNFALAEKDFREAVESDPTDYQSWIGLAASYDKLKRFELADRAYDQAIRIGGETVEVLNNKGYSYLLRGDRARARVEFERALQIDPANPIVSNNLRMLTESSVEAGRRFR